MAFPFVFSFVILKTLKRKGFSMSMIVISDRVEAKVHTTVCGVVAGIESTRNYAYIRKLTRIRRVAEVISAVKARELGYPAHLRF
jgi:dihydropteroate synthase